MPAAAHLGRCTRPPLAVLPGDMTAAVIMIMVLSTGLRGVGAGVRCSPAAVALPQCLRRRLAVTRAPGICRARLLLRP